MSSSDAPRVVAGLGLLALVATMAVLTASPASAQREDAVVLLVDTSGSMEEDDGTGRSRIDGAREAVTTFARELTDRSRITLRTYPGGPTGADGCESGVVRYPTSGGPASVDITEISVISRSLVADGDTPTSAALLAAAGDLRDAGYSAGTIVLVSDGLFACGPDPCVTAQDLAAEGFDITVHTVGFQIDDTGRENLECVAAATDGIYNDAEDSVELIQQLIKLSDVELTLDLGFEAEVSLITGTDGGGEIAIDAQVSSVGTATARDVVATFSFDDDEGPARYVDNPRRRVGNLSPGDRRQLSWTFVPELEFIDRQVPFTVTVQAEGGIRLVEGGTIDLLAAISMLQASAPFQAIEQVTLLGDGFSAGVGAADTTGRGGEGDCGRSRDTTLGSLYDGDDLLIVACSGALISDVIPGYVDDPQVAHIHDNGISDAVVMTLGADDLRLAELIHTCTIVDDCTGPSLRCPTSTVAQTCAGTREGYEDLLVEAVEGLYPGLVLAYRAVDDELNSPNALDERDGPAPVVVLAYPSPVPTNPYHRSVCGDLLDDEEMSLIIRLVDTLNQTIVAAAEAVADEGRPVHVVAEVQGSMLPDHTICDRTSFVSGPSHDDPVIAPIPLTGAGVDGDAYGPGPVDAVADSAVHPNTDGHLAMTATLVRWTTTSAAPEEVERDRQPSPIGAEPPSQSVRVTLSADGEGPRRLVPTDHAVEVRASGLLPGTAVGAMLATPRRAMARGVVGDDGTITLRAPVPPGVTLGPHVIRLDGISADGDLIRMSAPVRIIRPVHPLLRWLLYAGYGLAGLALIQTLWLLATRKRFRRRTAAAALVCLALITGGCTGAGDGGVDQSAPSAVATAADAADDLAAEPPRQQVEPEPADSLSDDVPASPPPTTTPATAPQPVLTGADVLVAQNFARLAGLRVGLIANQTSQSGGRHLIDLLHEAPHVELAAIFAPEHGVRGDAFAGDDVGDTVDAQTGVQIFSLYEQDSGFKPTPDELAGLDVLIYDLQDVGTRFYTFISTMGRAMEAAAESGVAFLVLDRPNPQGGDVIEGFTRTPDQSSFVSEFPIPSRYGLTAGELAQMIAGEGWKGTSGLRLDVVTLEGWDRGMRWDDTLLPWVPPSFGLPTAETALIYPGTVFFETLTPTFGGGTAEPFVRIGAPWVDAQTVADDLNSRNLDGVRFSTIIYVPEPHPERPQYADRIRYLGETVHAVRVEITDARALDSVAVGVHMVDAFRQHAFVQGEPEAIERGAFFDLLAGSGQLREMLLAGSTGAEIVAAWQADVQAFDAARQPYLLY